MAHRIRRRPTLEPLASSASRRQSSTMQLKVNGEDRSIPDAWREDSLLMVLREVLGLVGGEIPLWDRPVRRLNRRDR
jgi:hypothetical protein